MAGIVHDYLKNFLEVNLPKAKPGKKAKFVLGIGDAKLGAQLNETLGVTSESNELVQELLRGCVTLSIYPPWQEQRVDWSVWVMTWLYFLQHPAALREVYHGAAAR